MRNSDLSPRRARIGFLVVFLGACLYGMAARAISITELFFSGVPDDSLYYLKTALNFSQGLGSSFDGINLTNGYHPLWFLLLTMLFRFSPFGSDPVPNLYLAVFGQVFITACFIALLCHLVYRITRDLVLSISVAIAVLLRFTYRIVNLLETPLQLITFCAFVILLLSALRHVEAGHGGWRGNGRLVLLGLAGALVFLARTDMLILGVLAFVPLVLKYGLDLKKLAAYAVPLFSIVFCYWAVNYVCFGSAMPISGVVKLDATRYMFQTLGLRDALLKKLRFVFGPHELHSIPDKLLIQFFAFAPSVALGVCMWCHRRFSNEELVMVALSLLVVHWVMVGYGLSLLTRRCARALVPRVVLVGLLVGGVAVVSREDIRVTVWRAKRTLSGGFSARLDPNIPKPVGDPAVLLDLARFMQGGFFEGRRIGSFNAGILGFFSGRQVTNLDGLINSSEYRKLVRAGRQKDYLKDDFDLFVEYHAQYIDLYTSLGFRMYNVREYIQDPVPPFNNIKYNDAPDYRVYVRNDICDEFEAFLRSLSKPDLDLDALGPAGREPERSRAGTRLPAEIRL